MGIKDQYRRINFWAHEIANRRRLARYIREVADQADIKEGQRPVGFFNASTRLTYLSQNAAFSALASWGVQLSGVPVVNFACHAGMTRCVMGSTREDRMTQMPCGTCVLTSRRIYNQNDTYWFNFVEDKQLRALVSELSLEELKKVEYQDLPLGKIVLPSIRWVLRRHNLMDDETTRFFYREYILSAYSVVCHFEKFLDKHDPFMMIIFNGQMFPEAIVKHISKKRSLPVVTHEVGLRPLTGFFTPGEATAYPIDIPDDFEMTPEQDARLDAYLDKRFKGQFSMAGVKFWPEIHALGEEFRQKFGKYEQVVSIFSNVVFDTSQPHANTVFEHMFEWLDHILEAVKTHPETLFVLRAHPDEYRPGKESQETVAQWVRESKFTDFPNTIFIDANEYLSSYELIQLSKFMMVYNSSVGLEGILMGVPVLAGGQARYTHYPTVYFPQTIEKFEARLEEFLKVDAIELPKEFVRNARRFLYYQLFRTSLPFGSFVDTHKLQGYVYLKNFPIEDLKTSHSPTISTVLEGVMEKGDFLLDDKKNGQN